MTWFLIILTIFIILAIISAILHKPYECPYCKTKNKHYFSKKYISSRFTHETKSGSPDKRYKKNPQIYTYELRICCNKCSKIFTNSLDSLNFDSDFSSQIQKIEPTIIISSEKELKILEQEKWWRKSIGSSSKSFLNMSESQLDNRINELNKNSIQTSENINNINQVDFRTNENVLSQDEKKELENRLKNENKGNCSILLKEFNSNSKLLYIKIIKETFNLDLITAKNMVENTPIIICKGLSKRAANTFKKNLYNEGIIVEIIE